MQQMRLESLLVNGKKFLLNSVIHLDAQFNQLKCLCAQHLPTHLVRLNVDNNRLMSLDLSACEDLTYISARRNQLEELTSSHIPLSASCILMEDNYFNKVQLIDACPSLLTLTVNLYTYNSCLDLSGASRLTRLSLFAPSSISPTVILPASLLSLKMDFRHPASIIMMDAISALPHLRYLEAEHDAFTFTDAFRLPISLRFFIP